MKRRVYIHRPPRALFRLALITGGLTLGLLSAAAGGRWAAAVFIAAALVSLFTTTHRHLTLL